MKKILKVRRFRYLKWILSLGFINCLVGPNVALASEKKQAVGKVENRSSISPINSKEPTAVEVIQNFYFEYLNFKEGRPPKIHESEIPYSKSFFDLIQKNRKLCKLAKDRGICGFGAGGDVFLDAQEFQQDLNLQNSGFKAIYLNPDEVEVTMNIYPSSKTSGNYYHRKLRFKMIQEKLDGKNQWRIDDIISQGTSSRKWILEEIAELEKMPK